MLYDRLRVFVSSKMQELAPERAAIKEILDELNVDAWVFEQDAGARPETIQESYQEQLEASDLYIGVFWKGYGAYTIEEFELARATGTDCLIYQKGADSNEDRDPRLQAFLDRINDVESGLTIQWFETPEELREMVKRDTARWQTRIVRKYRQGGGRAAGPADPDLAVLREKVKQFWVEGVLSRSISGAGLVELAKESRADAVDHPFTPAQVPYEDGAVIAPETGVNEVFERLGRSLLILGEPGAGKTTMALELVRDLISRAERDGAQPVPVVLNLSAWSGGSGTLLAWVTGELSRKYHVPGRISRPWLEQRRLVLILDGLDEVADERRAACTEAINRLTVDVGSGGLVVTSRLEAYRGLSRSIRLRAGGAISLRPLVPAQITAHLEAAGEHLAGLRTALETDPALRELARTPLMLSVMSSAYRDRPADELTAGEPGSAVAGLFGAYVERAFDERKTARSYSRQATTSWLSWLAKRMSERGQTLFLIEDLQPSWLASRRQLGAYLLGFAVLFGSIFGGLCILYRMTPSAIPPGSQVSAAVVSAGEEAAKPGLGESAGWLLACAAFLLGIGITDGFRNGQRAGEARAVIAYLRRIAVNLVVSAVLWIPILSVMVVLLEPDFSYFPERFVVPAVALVMGAAALGARRSLSRSIETTESLNLESASAGHGALWGLLGGSVFAVVGLVKVGTWWAVLFWPLVGSALGAVLRGFKPRLVRGKTVPNQGLILTFRTSLRAVAMAVPVAAVVPAYCLALIGFYGATSPGGYYNDRIAQFSVTALVFSVVILASWFGGFDLGKHYILRAVIAATRQGPWSFRRLLDDANRRHLMQRVGGGYMFVHRPLLDHFAALDLPPPEADEIHDWNRERSASSAPVIAAMAVLAVIGAVTLFVSLEPRMASAVVGTVLLASGVLWWVIRTAVTSALRAGEREES